MANRIDGEFEHAAWLFSKCDEARLSTELSVDTIDLVNAGLLDILLPGTRRGTPLSLDAYMKKIAAIGQCNGRAAWAVGWCNAAAWIALKCFPDQMGSESPDEDGSAVVSMALSPEAVQAIHCTSGIVIKDGVWKPVVWNWRAQSIVLFIPDVCDAQGKQSTLIALISVSDIVLLTGQDTLGFEKFPDLNIAIRDVFVPKHRVVSIEALRQGTVAYERRGAHWQYRMCAGALLAAHAVIPVQGMAAAAIALAKDRKVVMPGADAVVNRASDYIDAATAILSRSYRKIELHAICNLPLTTEVRAELGRHAALAGQLFLAAIDSLARIDLGLSHTHGLSMQKQWRDARTLGLRGARAIRDTTALFRIS